MGGEEDQDGGCDGMARRETSTEFGIWLFDALGIPTYLIWEYGVFWFDSMDDSVYRQEGRGDAVSLAKGLL